MKTTHIKLGDFLPLPLVATIFKFSVGGRGAIQNNSFLHIYIIIDYISRCLPVKAFSVGLLFLVQVQSQTSFKGSRQRRQSQATGGSVHGVTLVPLGNFSSKSL